ncbi:MAG TPA: protein kinase [Solirubrobacterales bacterium]|nr:protein kinase [Solirubrobacterales bacterium]
MSDETRSTVPGHDPALLAEGLQPGTKFADHRIEAEIGRGGMGVVYRARHLVLDLPRALKVLAEPLAGDDRFRARFRREARLAAGLDHPGVVKVHHAGEEEGRLYISMSLIDGPELGQLVADSGPLDPARVGRLIGQIAAGLDAAHAAGLIHRDVKPSNVVLELRSGSENAVITDFGLARILDDASGLTLSGDFLGSVDFAAPEQIEGSGTDARTDVYSLGALAYFLLTGSAPFAGRSSAAKLVAHVNAERPRPSEAGAPVSATADEAVMRAMSTDPAERFPTAGRFAEILGPALASPAASRPQAAKPNWMVGALVVIIAAIAVTVLLALGGEPDGKGPARRAVAEGPGRVEATIRVGNGPTALVTGGGTTWVAARDRGEVQAISVGDANVEKAQNIVLDEGGEPISVAVGFESVWIVDGARDLLIRAPVGSPGDQVTIPLEDPTDVAVSPRSVWVAQEDADSVAQVNPETNVVDENLPVADGPRSVSYGEGGVWVACIEAGTALRIDAGDAEVQGKPIEAGTRPNDITVGEGGIWVIDNLEGVVRRIDPDDLVAGKPIEVGARPRGVVADSGSIWIANSEDGTVTRIDESRRRQVGEPIEVGAEPADISAGGGSLWTANFDDDTVSRIEP